MYRGSFHDNFYNSANKNVNDFNNYLYNNYNFAKIGNIRDRDSNSNNISRNNNNDNNCHINIFKIVTMATIKITIDANINMN